MEELITKYPNPNESGIAIRNDLEWNDLIEFLPPSMVKEMLDEALDKCHLHPHHKDYKQFVKGFKTACKMIRKIVECDNQRHLKEYVDPAFYKECEPCHDPCFIKPIEDNATPI